MTTVESSEIGTSELTEFVSVAGHFGIDVPGRLALELDVGSPDAVLRCWHGLCKIGLDRCIVPGTSGGADLPDAALAPLVEAVATGDAGTALLMLSSNIALATLTPELIAAVPETDRWAYVPAGGARPTERLPVLEDGKLTGTVEFALGAFGADGLVFACREDDALVLAAVTGGSSGKTERRVDDQLALGGAPVAEIVLDGAPAVRVGDEPEAGRADALLNAGVAAIARGVARRGREMALEYAENRYQGGGPIIIHGAVRDMLARMSERELAMTPVTDPSAPLDPAIALARKIADTDAAVESTIDAVQVFGGMGYMHETGVEKLMRDAKYCQLYPTPNWIARDALLETQRKRH
ncbi:MAG: acyl-CoA/acyl-ACP dehydrogenase [Actinobacteria bacterium]|nr:acyl-CoA/acyl-ACP dehydrogenase [Actinomycetota bacterium]